MPTRRKRILYLITGLKLGGAEVLVRDLALSLSPEYDLMVACLTHPEEVYRQIQGAGIKVAHLGAASLLHLPGAILRFFRLLIRFRPDLIHTHEIHADLAGRLGKLLGIPVVTTIHVKLLERPHLLWFDRLTSFLVDKYVAVSEEVARFTIERLRLPAERVTVIINGIDLAKYRTARVDRPAKRKEIGVGEASFVVGCVANFRPQKGHRYLIHAWSTIARRYPNARLVLVGNGPLDQELRRLVASLHLNNKIFFLGRREDVPQLLKIFDLFVLPSLYEGLPLSLVEALAAGCPVMATNIPENRDVLIRAKAGTMVPPGDPHALAEAIGAAIEKRKTIPNRPTLADFAWPTFVQAYRHLYQSL